MGTSDFESFHGWACPQTPLESSRLRQSRESPGSFSLEIDISVIVCEEMFKPMAICSDDASLKT